MTYTQWAITLVHDIVFAVLAWFEAIMVRIDGLNLWLGVTGFVLVFTALLLPLRGGRAIPFLGFGSDLARAGRSSTKSSQEGKNRKGD